jgi:DNA-binding PadR family transcriptional regulator
VGRPPNTSPQIRLVLETLSLSPGKWQHGYELCKITGIRSGTLYPLLIRLHERGLVEAEWRPPENPGRPPRHAYRLTATGLALARQGASASGPLRLSKEGA